MRLCGRRNPPLYGNFVFNIRIIDNGCYSIALQKQSNGNGIENIKKRVARNQGIVTFEQNALATGLQVSISIPLK